MYEHYEIATTKFMMKVPFFWVLVPCLPSSQVLLGFRTVHTAIPACKGCAYALHQWFKPRMSGAAVNSCHNCWISPIAAIGQQVKRQNGSSEMIPRDAWSNSAVISDVRDGRAQEKCNVP